MIIIYIFTLEILFQLIIFTVKNHDHIQTTWVWGIDSGRKYYSKVTCLLSIKNIHVLEASALWVILNCLCLGDSSSRREVAAGGGGSWGVCQGWSEDLHQHGLPQQHADWPGDGVHHHRVQVIRDWSARCHHLPQWSTPCHEDVGTQSFRTRSGGHTKQYCQVSNNIQNIKRIIHCFRKGLIYFSDFCQLILKWFRDNKEEKENFNQNMFKVVWFKINLKLKLCLLSDVVWNWSLSHWLPSKETQAWQARHSKGQNHQWIEKIGSHP